MDLASVKTPGGGEQSPISSSSRRRSGLLKHQLQLLKRKDGDQGRFEIAPISDTLSFEKGFFLFIRALQLLTQRNEGILVVGLAGPSGAGKTVFSEKVSDFLTGIATISMDNYNDSSRLIDDNFDDPRLIDFDTLLDNINDLKAGKAVDVPIYDFRQSCRVGSRRVEVPTSRVVVVEGIYALNERLRPLLDLRVSITGGVHFDLVKRVLRDIDRAGQEPEDIIHQISETVYPMYKAFIEPDLETAHIKIVNKFNPFSGFQNASYILKSPKAVSEEQIRSILSPSHKEFTEQGYDIYLLPPNEDPETCQSYLRMRNREGRYSLMFEEWVTDGPFIISPRITFEVSVRILGGLMALGYEMGTILKRSSHVFHDDHVTIKLDTFEQLRRCYVQVQGKERPLVEETGRMLGLEGTYVPRSYIEQVQLEKLTAEFQALPEDLKSRLTIEEGPGSPYGQIWAPRSSPTKSLMFKQKGDISRDSTDGASSLVVGTKQQILLDGDQIQERPRRDRTGSLDASLHREHAIGHDGSAMNGFQKYTEQQVQTKILAQLTAVSEKLDELMLRMSLLESRAPQQTSNGVGPSSMNRPYGRTGSGGADGARRVDQQQANGSNGRSVRLGVGGGVNMERNSSFSFTGGPSDDETARSGLDASGADGGSEVVHAAVEAVGEEMKRINQGQRQMSRQLTILGDMLGSLNAWDRRKKSKEGDGDGGDEGMLANYGRLSKTTRMTVSLCGLVGFFAFSSYVVRASLRSSSSS